MLKLNQGHTIVMEVGMGGEKKIFLEGMGGKKIWGVDGKTIFLRFDETGEI